MPWCETLRKWVNWMLRWLGYLWPWIFKVKLYPRNGRLDCHGTKGTGVVRMPWCKMQPLCDPETEDIFTMGWLEMSAFPSTCLVALHGADILCLESNYLLIFWQASRTDFSLMISPGNLLAHWLLGYAVVIQSFETYIISRINILSIFCAIPLRWMLQDFHDDYFMLVQVMVWSHQATRNQFGQRHMSPYGNTRLQ